MPPCSESGCSKLAYSKGLCQHHYKETYLKAYYEAYNAKKRKGPHSRAERMRLAKERRFADVKTCEECGCAFTRDSFDYSIAVEVWKERRYCSQACRDQAGADRFRAYGPEEQAKKYEAHIKSAQERGKPYVRGRTKAQWASDMYWGSDTPETNHKHFLFRSRQLLHARRNQALKRMEKRNQERETQR
jgi:hypothetical protein